MFDKLPKFHLAGSVTWGDVIRALPTSYLAYFPAAVFLGKIHGTKLLVGLLVELGWLVALIIVCRVAFRRGVRRYSAFGG